LNAPSITEHITSLQ